MRVAKHSSDWCHLCGERKKELLDVFYDANAEHPSGQNEKYIRICYDCVGLLAKEVEECPIIFT